jgi:hypothetical protein
MHADTKKYNKAQAAGDQGVADDRATRASAMKYFS